MKYIVVSYNTLGMMSTGNIFYVEANSKIEAIKIVKLMDDENGNDRIQPLVIELSEDKINTKIFDWN